MTRIKLSLRRSLVLVLALFVCTFVTLKLCWNQEFFGKGLLTVAEAVEKCLWCKIRVFDFGRVTVMDKNTVYLEVEGIKVFLVEKIDLTLCEGKPSYFFGRVYKKLGQDRIFIDDISSISYESETNAAAVCYVNEAVMDL